MQQDPNNRLYIFSLGNLYYELGDFKKAEVYFKKALEINPQDPEILNNLAWLYATSEMPELRKPEEALMLSRKAALLAPKAHILDTLGESYFVNGRYAEAVQALEQAIATSPDNLSYYEGQLKKFKKHLFEERNNDTSEENSAKVYAL